MQFPGLARPTPPRYLSLLTGLAAGTVLIVAGLTLAYATFATPLVERLAGSGPLGGGANAVGSMAWPLAVVATAVFLGVGAARLAEVLATVRPARPRELGLAAGLPEDVLLARNVDPGDGRPLPVLLVGRFGAAVVRELPAASATRREGRYWEARVGDGWVRIENPLDRTARDAERVRRWLAHDDQDFVVRVYAAVIAPDAGLPRTPTCAVISRDQLPAWLRSLPQQRSLTDGRRARLAGIVRGRS
ncbi:MAG TPA: hypothetical protein VLA44_03965 [Clostridia bacterium]|nr:hypothetical protein [Clostridia bacterium]